MAQDSKRLSGLATRRKILGSVGATGAAALAGCGGNSGGSKDAATTSGTSGGSQSSTTQQQISSLSGAGSSFVNPLMQKWATAYKKQNGLEVNYRSIGSGGGVSNLMDKTVMFAGSDAPLQTKQYQKVQKEGGCVHVPESLGAIAPVFNVKGVSDLKLTGKVLGDIFLGKITKWNDSEITKLNPDANLPDAKITVAHRSDASGTTYGFTGYLNQVNSEWKSKVGQTETPDWPVGVGGKGNEGVASIMTKQNNAIGYVELTYATQNDIDIFKLENKAGNFVSASPEGVSAAAAGAAKNLPKGTADWSDVSISNAPGEKTWPISTFTYIIMYHDFGKAYSGDKASEARMKATLDFVTWAVTNGQQYAPDLHYPKLPDAAVTLDTQTLSNMTFNGDTVLQG